MHKATNQQKRQIQANYNFFSLINLGSEELHLSKQTTKNEKNETKKIINTNFISTKWNRKQDIIYKTISKIRERQIKFQLNYLVND